MIFTSSILWDENWINKFISKDDCHYMRTLNEDPPYAEVEITRFDGMNIEIYSDAYGTIEQYDLAKAIEKATGKELIEKIYR